jgi:hypothetical protein
MLRTWLISSHQTAIALDIRCEDRGRLSFDGVRFQGSGWFTEDFDTADLKEAKARRTERIPFDAIDPGLWLQPSV